MLIGSSFLFSFSFGTSRDRLCIVEPVANFSHLDFQMLSCFSSRDEDDETPFSSIVIIRLSDPPLSSWSR